jgi:hypothetical protein
MLVALLMMIIKQVIMWINHQKVLIPAIRLAWVLVSPTFSPKDFAQIRHHFFIPSYLFDPFNLGCCQEGVSHIDGHSD